MKKMLLILIMTALVTAFVGVKEQAHAAAPSLFGRGAPEADPKKDYYLKESDGNWFIMVKKFSGDNAPLQAKKLVYELRASYKLHAFVFKYDPDKMDMDALSQNMGKSKKFHYQTERVPEYAVLVGGFPTGEDPTLQKTMTAIRKSQPRSLKNDPQSQAIAARFQESAKKDAKYAGYGPLGGATPVPNPLLPSEYFNHKGVVDPFVAKLNSDSKYSLLNNPKTYTVRIATFSGGTAMGKANESFSNKEFSERLQYAGMRAAALCEALRNANVEAWEFHDRDCSFVTIGSFDQYGKVQEDGSVELTPQIGAIMKKYGGKLVNDSEGNSQYEAYAIEVEINDPASTSRPPKKKRMTLACDVRPVIIVVPQRSGEESVKKIALAQQQMKRAQERKEANAAAAALKEAQLDIESTKFFANHTRPLTEEELKELDPQAWAAINAASAKNTNAASVSQTARVATPNAQYAANAEPDNRAISRPQISAQPSKVATNAPLNRNAVAAPTTGNQIPANNAPKVVSQTGRQVENAAPSKTAQRPVAPTY